MADIGVARKSFKSPPIHRTPEYRAYAAFYGMLARCGNANGKNPTYADVELRMTLDEWLDWSIPLYVKFIAENPSSSPSVSRVGDVGHYEIGNIEIISLSENASRQRRDTTCMLRPDGTKMCSKCLEVMPKEKFSKQSRTRDKLATWCKSCSAANCQAWRDRKRIASSTGRAIGP